MLRHPSILEPSVFSWYLRAAVRGNPYAQFNLGLLYKDGVGVPRDEAAACRWLR